MITQKIIARTDSLKLDKIISRYGEDSMRQVVFIIVRPDPESEELIPITIPEDAVGSFRILKPSGNFVIVPMSKSVLASGETAFDVVLPASANTAKGSGYYDIRITSETDKYYFTAQGDFIIDDNIISDEVLEDVSEVNGLIFPDDFLTVEDHVAYIDDDVTSTESTWSSDKISEEIEAHAGGDVSKTVSGNPITFDDGADAPLVKCVTQITGYQSGTGTPSPDNIRPIVAYTEGEIEVSGKNLFDKTTYTFTSEKYVSLSTGNIGTNSSYACTESYIPCSNLAGQTITLNHIPGGNQPGMAFYDSNNDYISGGKGDAITVPSNAASYRFTVPIEYASGDDVQIELGSTATTYEPYTSTTHTTTYPSAIYRGSEDVVNGEVTAECNVIDIGSLTWFRNTAEFSYSFFYANVADRKKGTGFILSSAYDVVSSRSSLTDGTIAPYNLSGSNAIAVRDDRFSDVASFTTGVTGVQLAYELATPTTSSVTPTNLPIKSLSGYNHIESSTGDMEVEYITQRFQPLIDSIAQL